MLRFTSEFVRKKKGKPFCPCLFYYRKQLRVARGKIKELMRKEAVLIEDQRSTLTSSATHSSLWGASRTFAEQKETPPAAARPLRASSPSPSSSSSSSHDTTGYLADSPDEHLSRDEIVNVSQVTQNEQNQPQREGDIVSDARLRAAPPERQQAPVGEVVSRGAQNERKMFLVFVKVLLKYLEKANDDSLRKRAKSIISECTARNRNGDSDYLCLQAAVERRLQQILGKWHWDRAQICYHRFLERCHMPTTIAVTSSACV